LSGFLMFFTPLAADVWITFITSSSCPNVLSVIFCLPVFVLSWIFLHVYNILESAHVNRCPGALVLTCCVFAHVFYGCRGGRVLPPAHPLVNPCLTRLTHARQVDSRVISVVFFVCDVALFRFLVILALCSDFS